MIYVHLDCSKDNCFLIFESREPSIVQQASIFSEIPNKRYLVGKVSPIGTPVWRVYVSDDVLEYLTEKNSQFPNLFEFDEGAKTIINIKFLSKLKLEQRMNIVKEFINSKTVPSLDIPQETEQQVFKHHQPFAHQKVALAFSLQQERTALLMEMGTGKTAVVVWRSELEAINKLGGYEKACEPFEGDLNKAYKVIILCPKSIMFVWKNEYKKFCTIPFDLCLLDDNQVTGKLDSVIETVRGPSKLKIFVSSYESAIKLSDILIALKADLVVADESTKIKNNAAKRTKAAIKISNTAPHRMILTGNAVANNVLDLYSQYEFLGKGTLGYGSFLQYKVNHAYIVPYKKTVKIMNECKLRQRMAPFTFIITKKDCLDLPEKTYSMRYVYMEGDQKEAYEQMRKSFMVEFEWFFNNLDAPSHIYIRKDPKNLLGSSKQVLARIVLTKYLRLSQITSGFLSLEDKSMVIFKSNNKLDECLILVDDLLNTSDRKKIIIWSVFKRDIQAIWNALNQKGIYAVKYDGTTDNTMSQAAIDLFNTDDNVKVFVGNVKKGGMGITLLGTDNVRTTDVIYYANSFSYDARAQSEDRCHRVGLRNPITYWDLITKNTIDEYIYNTLKDKKQISESIQDVQELARTVALMSPDDPTS
ncbi:MAG: hypothetical protein KatS3mg087_1328 [Patescibacteria group bacterium]|nr:MAG: hypothetical protein KatS3mg087_1328 [Patescibacteria group bacterium]